MKSPLLATALLALALQCGFSQDLLWEDEGLTDEAAIPSGSTFAYNGTAVTLTWSVTTDGGFATYPGGAGSTGGGDDYVTYESSQEGGHTGLVLLAFNNNAYDPDDYITLTLTFDTPQLFLRFTILDIDTSNWDDGVEVLYNGTNNARTAGIWYYDQSNASLRTVTADNEGYYDGWEGTNTSADPTQNYGNVTLNFVGTSVSSVQIRFFSTDDGAPNDPGGQKIGISDLLVVVPEPSTAFGVAALIAVAAFARPPRRKQDAAA